ncbi:RNA polymerase sigma factor [Flavihumibacter petaseus]|uniref:Putative RNA polymerase ECF-type sigma factor n=1 Tax=Flavihumibacter petaseus NBRC 106054 TaxID=1220578 RepID=A0A0E9MZC3_9BACT|nr:sigma-70 family RNA polymerase sigma factor [Flavihumibacter petaseus]GAO42964.1 putative RNA polymerase ECF-type sigma factor [Flavihumibacter petaseus NBRC 106054]
MKFIPAIPDPTASEQELLQRYHDTGDLALLGKLYSPYMDLVFGLCMKYLEDNEAARDAVMQIFEQLVVKLRQHRVEYFKSWLYTLAKNHCLMELRSGKKARVVSLPDNIMQSEAPVHLNGSEQKEMNLQALEKCISALTTEQQRAVTLFYLEQRSYHEIADQTGLDWNKVRSLIQNGRRNLKICMEKKIHEQQL